MGWGIVTAPRAVTVLSVLALWRFYGPERDQQINPGVMQFLGTHAHVMTEARSLIHMSNQMHSSTHKHTPRLLEGA